MDMGQWIGLFLLVWVLAFRYTKLSMWCVTAALLIGWFYFTHQISSFLAGSYLTVLIVVAGLFNIRPLRRRFITQHIIDRFRKVLPPLSQTEQDALNAGDVWWDGKLFRGLPDWNALRALPHCTLSPDERAFLDNQVVTLCQMVDTWQMRHSGKDLSPEVWDYLKKERFFGMIIPKRYGGLGFSALGHSSVVMKIASRDFSTAVTAMVPNSLGPAELILRYGTEQQKNYYLPRLAKGEEVPCFALTEPEAGSDASGISDIGVVCKGMFEGKEVIGIRLTWDKRYITLAPVATVLGLAFQLNDPDSLLGENKALGITLCLLPTSYPGVQIGHRHLPISANFLNGPTRGENVFIPLDWIIGGQAYIGKGWRMLMECLSAGRGISLPALSTGFAKHCLRVTGSYAKLREQFNVSIGHFEGVQQSLGQIAGFTYMLEAMREMTICGVDMGFNPAVCTAIAKYHMTEITRQIVNHAMDIHGGRGIIEGPRNYLSDYYQGVPIAITVEGANILTRNLIIFGQGAIRCHPYILEELREASSPDQNQGLIDFDTVIFRHIGYIISNFVRTITLGVTRGHYQFKSPEKNHPLGYYYRQLGAMSCALALVADVTMIMLGGALKRKESLSARLGDVLSYLYIGAALLRYFEHHNRPITDHSVVKWGLQWSLYQMQQAFSAFFANFPNRTVANMLQFCVFPLGKRYRLPKDTDTHHLAEQAMLLSDWRTRMLQDTYIHLTAQDNVGRLELAFSKRHEVQSLLDTIHQAVRAKRIAANLPFLQQCEAGKALGILSENDCRALQAYEVARIDAIRVDEFDANSLKESHAPCHVDQSTKIA